MKIDVIFNLHPNFEGEFENKSVVVVDLLRATSTIVTTLGNGAKSVIPAESVSEVVKIAKNLDKETYLLCGERNTKVIDGFDLGNSPLEFTSKKVKEKKIILTTSNGTNVFNFVKHSKNVLIGSILNLSKLIEKMRLKDSEWTIICAGRDNHFDSSDAICAGMIISEFSKYSELEMNDAANLSLLLYNSCKHDLLSALKKTDHGKILVNNGFEEDLKFIIQKDIYPINCIYSNNNIYCEE